MSTHAVGIDCLSCNLLCVSFDDLANLLSIVHYIAIFLDCSTFKVFERCAFWIRPLVFWNRLGLSNLFA